MGNTQYVHVYPTKEQQQKLVQFRMDSLQKAGQDHLQRIQDNEKQINDEAQSTMDSTMQLLSGVDQSTQQSVGRLADQEKQREAELDDKIAELRRRQTHVQELNIKATEQLDRHTKTLALKKTALSEQRALLDKKAEEIRNTITKMEEKRALDQVQIEALLSELLNIEGVTDASMKALMSLLCQLNNLPMMIDKTTNMGLKQGVDAICEWLDNGVKKARLHLSAWEANLDPQQTLEWSRRNNVNAKVIKAIADNELSIADLFAESDEEWNEIKSEYFSGVPAPALRKLRKFLDQVRHNEKAMMPRLGEEFNRLSLGVAPVCVWHGQVEGQVASTPAAILAGTAERKAITSQ